MKTSNLFRAVVLLTLACSDSAGISPGRLNSTELLGAAEVERQSCREVSGPMRGDVDLSDFSFGSGGSVSGGITGSYRMRMPSGQRSGDSLSGPSTLTIRSAGGGSVTLQCFSVITNLDAATSRLHTACAFSRLGRMSVLGEINHSQSRFVGTYRGTVCER